MNPRALDLYCGDGGASMGLARAGFEVNGVDSRPHPRYPFLLLQADALEVLHRLLDYRHAGIGPKDNPPAVDFIWASPPCQKFSRLRFMPGLQAEPPRSHRADP